MKQKTLKTAILAASLAALLCSSFAFSEEIAEEPSIQTIEVAETVEVTQKAQYGTIDAQGLKALIDTNAPFALLDARGPTHYDGRLIPGAKLASVSDSDEVLNKLLGDKSELVVVYCYSSTCPLAEKMANRLIGLHYQNVVVYSGGIKDWSEVQNFPVEKA